MNYQNIGPYPLGATWEIPIEFNKADGTDLPIASGTHVIFQMTDDDGNTIMVRDESDGIRLNDADDAGIVTGAILIVTPVHQDIAIESGLTRGQFNYKVQLEFPDDVIDVQAMGAISVEGPPFLLM